MPNPFNSLPATEQHQRKIAETNEHILISSSEEGNEEEEGSPPARPKLNKGKAVQTDPGSESEYEDLEGEVRTVNDLKVGQPELGGESIEQPELGAEDIETLRQKSVPIFQQSQLTHTYRCL